MRPGAANQLYWDRASGTRELWIEDVLGVPPPPSDVTWLELTPPQSSAARHRIEPAAPMLIDDGTGPTMPQWPTPAEAYLAARSARQIRPMTRSAGARPVTSPRPASLGGPAHGRRDPGRKPAAPGRAGKGQALIASGAARQHEADSPFAGPSRRTAQFLSAQPAVLTGCGRHRRPVRLGRRRSAARLRLAIRLRSRQ